MLNRLLLAAALLINAGLLWNFHDQHWYAIDEGNYAHVAERLLGGEVLHRDVQDVHAGYINFLNTAAFAIFGVDLVSLRYPLIAAAFAQALLIFLLLARQDPLLAAVASVAAVALGVLQFLDPTANWYCLFLVVCLVAWLRWVPVGAVRTVGAGVLIGVIAMFRQLTGVWVAMSVLVILLREEPASDTQRGRDTVLARGLVLLMLATLLAYLVLTRGSEASGVLLVALWPATILWLLFRRVRVSNRAALVVTSRLALGAMAGALPIPLYHVAHGSLRAWFEDTVLAAAEIPTLSFLDAAYYAILPVAGMLNLIQMNDLVAMANGAYWIVLSLLPLANGILVLRWFRHGDREVMILPIVAAFYALVAIHLPGPIYLHYTVGLTLAAVLSRASGSLPRAAVPYAAAMVTALVAVAVVFQAAQSPHRRPVEIARGHRTLTRDTPTCPPFKRSTLRIEAKDCQQYQALVAAITAETRPADSIFAVPSDAELYFLAERRNPFRFFNTALGVRTSEQLSSVLELLAREPPRLVTYRPDDKYNTPSSRAIMEYVRTRYDRFDTIGDIELYRPALLQGPEDQ